MPLKINNSDARKLWLASNGLAAQPTGPLDVLATVKRLGFVQLDTIQVVVRAHHHIIWSRNQNYREEMLHQVMTERRDLFEHYTHDASLIPMDYYPLWQRQFRRKKAYYEHSKYYTTMPDAKGRAAIKARIADEGPLSTHAFDTKAATKGMWARPPHKLALDYMWYTGALATSHRRNFTKFYDLSERVIPQHIRAQSHSDQEQINWLCETALDRMGFATLTEIKKFWEATDRPEVAAWATRAKPVPVMIQSADGVWAQAFAPANIETRMADLKPPTSRLRILNPFDPALRDRNRLARLFGFDYRVEMFVPAAKRKWGYYVYPLLEGARLVGRIEVKADRAKGILKVDNLWAEQGVSWTKSRRAKLEAELTRLARLAGVSNVSHI